MRSFNTSPGTTGRRIAVGPTVVPRTLFFIRSPFSQRSGALPGRNVGGSTFPQAAPVPRLESVRLLGASPRVKRATAVHSPDRKPLRRNGDRLEHSVGGCLDRKALQRLLGTVAILHAIHVGQSLNSLGLSYGGMDE